MIPRVRFLASPVVGAQGGSTDAVLGSVPGRPGARGSEGQVALVGRREGGREGGRSQVEHPCWTETDIKTAPPVAPRKLLG